MNSTILIILLCIIAPSLNAQQPKVAWTKTIGGSGNERSNGITTDNKGNIIVVGRFQSPSMQVDKITLTKNASDKADVADIFILKLNKKGKALWGISAGHKGDDHVLSCVTDKQGNIYVVGWFESKTLTFGEHTLTNKTEKGSDMFVAKFSPKGKCLWANNAGGEGGNGDYSTIALDNDNNVVISGAAGIVMDFGNGVRFTHEKGGIYLAKYSGDGKLLWAQSPNGKGEAQGVGTDSNGNIFIGGFFINTLSLDDITLHSNTKESSDAFVAKYSPEGKIIWAKNFGGDGGEIASCETDPFGNVYLAGMFFSKTVTTEKTVLTNNGAINAFIAKYDKDGTLLWARSAGGNNGEAPGTAIREFYVDDHGNAFCTGSNWSEFTFAGSPIKTVAGSEDIFIFQYDKDGNEIWGADYGGKGRNAGRGITSDKEGSIFLTGSFDETQLKIGDHTLTNVGDSDIYLVKFSVRKK